MPIYEYRCTACGHEMDHFHRSRSEPKPACASCDEDALERLVSLTSFQLKGEGWYVTDYAKKADKTPAPSSASDTGTSSAAKTPPSTAAWPKRVPAEFSCQFVGAPAGITDPRRPLPGCIDRKFELASFCGESS